MRVHLVDPAAYTPPYDRALASALARAGAEVELITSAFGYGDVPPRPGCDVREAFYRWAPARGRRYARLAQHVPDMLRYRRAARAADVVHFQWLSVQALDARLLPRRAPAGADRPRRAPARAQAVASSPASARSTSGWTRSSCTPSTAPARLRDELGLDPAKVHVIPHGVLDDLDGRARRRRRSPRPGRSCSSSA